MTDGDRSGQGLHQAGFGEVVAHIAKSPRRVEALFGVMADDTARLLSTVLQRVQAKSHKICGIHHANDAKYAAFFFQLIIVKRMRRRHGRRVVGRGVGHGSELRFRGVGPVLIDSPRSVTKLSGNCDGFRQRCVAGYAAKRKKNAPGQARFSFRRGKPALVTVQVLRRRQPALRIYRRSSPAHPRGSVR